MCVHIGKAETSSEIVEHQARFIKEQEDNGTPANVLSVRCPCLKLVRVKHAYRCLYCNIFFCKECAEKHFGQTVEEYRTANPNIKK